jgi:phosphoserine phosphatase
MVEVPVTLRVGTEELVRYLEQKREPGPSGLAFDADGTLWSGDVGEDVFHFACENGLIRKEALDELARVAREHGVAEGKTPSDLAREIHVAYRLGKVDERLTCEVMTWSYAGFSPEELRLVAREAFSSRGLAGRVREILAPVQDWARREALRIIVVSASPRAIVDEALKHIGFDVFDIAGAEPVVADGRIAARMAGPVPYGADKRAAGLALLTGHDWLASFGDNSFDVELLRAARVGVAVCPKPGLRARLNEIDGVLVVE